MLRRLLRRILRGLRALVASPALVGAAYVVALAGWAGTRSTAVEADVGDARRALAVETFMTRRFAPEILRMKIGIAATAIGLGLLLGLVAELLKSARRARARSAGVGFERERRPLLRDLGESLILVVVLHAALVAWAMADTPQLYAAEWYAQGGIARTAQVLVTDRLGPRGVVVVTMLLALLYVGPSRLAYLARRATAPIRRPLRALVTRLAMRAAAPLSAFAVAGFALLAPGGPGGATSGTSSASPPGAGASAAPSASHPPRPRASGSAGARPHPRAPAASASVVAVAHPPAAASATVAVPAAAAPGSGTGSGSGSGTGSGSGSGTGSGKTPNILILAADSLRADRLDPKIAPNLSALAARGARFDRAYVSLARTFPSWVTILTGRHAHHHGVRSMFPTWEERAKDFDALPSRFASAGVTTAVVSDYAGDIFGRIDLGFGRVETPSFDFRQLIRQKALERETPLLPVLHSALGRRLFPVMRELASAADPILLAQDVETELRSLRKTPFFMTVFFSTAHFPYAAPAPYYAKYTDPTYRGRYKYHKPLGLGVASEAPPNDDDIRQIRALYDGAVTGIDDGVGRVLHALDRLGLADNTIVVVTADHGEMLFDDGHGQGHGDHLFGDQGTHVPLVVYDPRLASGGGAGAGVGRRIADVVRDVDLAPTLYELAGVVAPADLDGRSLAPSLRGEPLAARFAYSETELWFTEDIPGLAPELRMPYPGVMGLTELDSRHNAEIVLRKDMAAVTTMARHRMIRDARYKLLYIPTRTGVRYMLFDTQEDPAETRDIAASAPNEVARLRAELWSWMLKDPTMEQKEGFLVPRDARAPR